MRLAGQSEPKEPSPPDRPARRRRVGRKRDPLIEPKVYAAALRVYAAEGWGGFSFETVAREAGVGKPAIYLRWQSQENLLLRAFAGIHFPTARDCGSLREDFLDYALQWAEWYGDPVTPNAAMRIQADCKENPELAAMHKKVIVQPKERAAKAIARRAIARGELVAGIPELMIVEMLVGSMQMHWSWAKTSKDQSLKSLNAYAKILVDVILVGAASFHAPAESANAAWLPAASNADAAQEVAEGQPPSTDRRR
jgi:AcrR family transcriptional regulator